MPVKRVECQKCGYIFVADEDCADVLCVKCRPIETYEIRPEPTARRARRSRKNSGDPEGNAVGDLGSHTSIDFRKVFLVVVALAGLVFACKWLLPTRESTKPNPSIPSQQSQQEEFRKYSRGK